MARLMRILPVALAGVLIVVALAACTSGGGDSSYDYGDGESIDFVSADPQHVLEESAEYFEQDVESLRAEMDFAMTLGGVQMDAEATLAFQSPDQMHMTMTIAGLGTFEALILGNDMYVNVPPKGWVSFSLEDLGAEELGLNVESFTDAFDSHSMIDYEQVIEGIGGEVENLGEETIDGGTYQHYKATITFEEVVAAFADGFGATEDLNLDEASGPLTINVWVSTQTLLPHQATLSGEIQFGVTPMTFDATLRFLDYNKPVDIPAAPEDAVSLSEMFGSLLQQ